MPLWKSMTVQGIRWFESLAIKQRLLDKTPKTCPWSTWTSWFQLWFLPPHLSINRSNRHEATDRQTKGHPLFTKNSDRSTNFMNWFQLSCQSYGQNDLRHLAPPMVGPTQWQANWYPMCLNQIAILGQLSEKVSNFDVFINLWCFAWALEERIIRARTCFTADNVH